MTFKPSSSERMWAAHMNAKEKARVRAEQVVREVLDQAEKKFKGNKTKELK